MAHSRKKSPMSLKKPTIVIFDMDGTSVRHLNPVILNIMERLDDVAFRTSKFFGWIFHRGGKGHIIPPEEETKRKKVKTRAPSLIVHRAIHKARRKPVDQIVKPCAGIYRVLKLLKEHGVPTALVSNGLGKGYGHDIVDKFGFDHYFGAFVFREDIRKSKPDPEALIHALERLNIKPTADDVIWFVGDRHKDVSAALAAEKVLGCKVEPVAYGVNAAAAIIEKGVHSEHIMMSYITIYKHLESLLGPKSIESDEELAEAASRVVGTAETTEPAPGHMS